jgi:Synergist-CTERM protein sorting domain-containing protein
LGDVVLKASDITIKPDTGRATFSKLEKKSDSLWNAYVYDVAAGAVILEVKNPSDTIGIVGAIARVQIYTPSGGGGGGGAPVPGGTTPPPSGGGDDEDPPTPGGPVTDVIGTPNADGTFEAKTAVVTESGDPVTSVVIDSASPETTALAAIGLSVEYAGGEIVVSGTATDIGEFLIPITVNGTEEQTVRVVINAIPHDDAVIADTATKAAWPTELATSGSDTLFVTYLPTNLTAEQAAAAVDLRAAGVGLSSVTVTIEPPESLVLGRGAGEVYFKASGRVTDYATAAIDTVSYRIGINRYTQAANVKLSETLVTDNRTEPTDPTPSSGSSGCDAGFGAFALLAAAAGAVLLRKKS